MMKFRVSVLLCLVLALCVRVGRAEPYDTPQYTSLPETYAEGKLMIVEADWYVKALQDPVNTLLKDTDGIVKYLNMNPLDAKLVAQQGPEPARRVIGRSLVSKTGNDPFFEAVMKVAKMQIEDRAFALQAMQFFVDSVRLQVKQYPKVKDAAKDVLLAKLDDPRPGIRYTATVGLGLLGNSPAPPEVLTALIKQLENSDEVLVGVTADALAQLGDTKAVKPLMERFLSLQENVDTTVDNEDSPPAPGAQVPSEQPLNQARLSLAIAVDKLAGLNLGFSGLTLKDDVLRRYEQLATWWEENKGKY